MQIIVTNKKIAKAMRIVRHLLSRTYFRNHMLYQFTLALKFEKRAPVELLRKGEIADRSCQRDDKNADRSTDRCDSSRKRESVSRLPRRQQCLPLPAARFEYVANATHGANQFFFKGFVDLDTQPSDRNLDNICIGIKIDVPDK